MRASRARSCEACSAANKPYLNPRGRKRYLDVMVPQFRPSDADVQDHLAHFRSTASLQRWERGDASLELLLGLREPTIDDQLRAIAPRLETSNDDWSLGADFVLRVVTDRSEGRIAEVVERTCSALPLAWFAPNIQEAERIVDRLTTYVAQRASTFGVPSALFATICDLAGRAKVGVPEELGRVAPDRWLEQSSLATVHVATGPIATTSPTQSGRWYPDWPQALIRDPLTGLLSRSVLSRNPHRFRLPNESQIAALPTEGVVVLDVDRMKHILDYFGMRTGDHVLRAIADGLQRCFGDNVIRYGGDEFLIVCERHSLQHAAAGAVEAVRALRIGSFEAPDHLVEATVSAGAAAGTDPFETLRAAEEALERAKKGGRNRCEVA